MQKFAPISLSTDGTPPTTEVRNADAKWHNRSVKLTFVATDNAGGSGVDFTEYKIGDGGWTPGTSATVPAPANHSGDGPVTVRYRSVDREGNEERANVVKVYIDTTPPNVTVRNAYVGKGKRAVVRFAVRDALSAKVRVVAAIETTSFRVLHQAESGWIAQGGTNGWRFTAHFSTGWYRIRIVAYDLAGNRSGPGIARLVVH